MVEADSEYRAQHDLARAPAMLDEAEHSMQTLVPPAHFAFGSLNAERAPVAREEGATALAIRWINRASRLTNGRRGGGKPRLAVSAHIAHAPGFH
jgi:hypothetical protein